MRRDLRNFFANPFGKKPAKERVGSRSQIDYDTEYHRYRDKGLRQLAQGRAADAIEALGHAALLSPTDPAAHFDLGRALQSAGKVEAARHVFLRALNLNPTSEKIRSTLLALPPLPPGRGDFKLNQLLRVSNMELAFFVDEIKKGGFGAVYIVNELLGDERWAIKTFQAKFLWSDEDHKRFEREALNWIMLDRHPNIVSARSLMSIEGFPCLMLDYVSGGNVAELLSRGPLLLTSALKLALDLCDGMAYAHAKLGIIHRDIKPSNCLLTEEGILKVTDFGLARAFCDAQEKSLGLSEMPIETKRLFTTVLGTPQYMAPEQFHPGATLDTRTDIYSFGVMFYEMLTRDLPPLGCLASSHIAESTHVCQIPNPLSKLILSCVEANPTKRPTNFHQVRSLLEAAHRDLLGETAPPEAGPIEMTASDWTGKGLALDHLGHSEEACACLKRAVDLSPADATVWMNYGGQLRKLGRLEESLSCIERGLQIDPNEPGLWKNKGLILDSLNQPEQAQICLKKAIELQGDMFFFEYQAHDLGAQLSRMGDFDSALQCFEQGLKRNERDAQLWHDKAIILGRMGRSEEALASCNEGLAIEPRSYALWWTEGAILNEIGRLEEALLCYDRALEIGPGDVSLWINRGAVLLALQRYSDVLACCQSGLKTYPDNWILLANNGRALLKLGRCDEALARFEDGLKVAPRQAVLWECKGHALYGLRRWENALSCFEYAQTLAALAILEEDQSEYEFGRWEEMLVCIDKLLETNSQDAALQEKRGSALVELGRFEEALECYDELLKSEPENPKLWLAKGQALSRASRFHESLVCFDRGLQIEPTFVLWNCKGNALKSLGKQGQAEECFQNAHSSRLPRRCR